MPRRPPRTEAHPTNESVRKNMVRVLTAYHDEKVKPLGVAIGEATKLVLEGQEEDRSRINALKAQLAEAHEHINRLWIVIALLGANGLLVWLVLAAR